MATLIDDLQSKKDHLNQFNDLTIRILTYISEVVSKHTDKLGYRIYSSQIASNTKYTRPINTQLFIFNPHEFRNLFVSFRDILNKVGVGELFFSEQYKSIIDSVAYTIQQSIGIGLDLLVNPNSARKHVGNRFEEFIASVFDEIGLPNKKLIIQIPYSLDEGEKIYKCEIDLVISPHSNILSTSSNLDKNEIILSLKTTSKDRMGKMFMDKMLLEKFVGHEQKVIGIFLNDVQRKKTSDISFTLVSGLFMVYSNFLTKVNGVYYIDPPPVATKKPLSNYIKTFSELITKDLGLLLSS